MTSETDTTRGRVLELLASGNATISEAARLADVDRQLVHYWAQQANINARLARSQRLAKIWEKM